MEWIFHIAERTAWEHGVAAGRYRAASLASEGFIHCSSRAQVVETANRYYQGRSGLLLLCIDPGRLGSEVKYEGPAHPAASAEQTRDRQDLFAHVYGPIDLASVARVVELEPSAAGVFAWPAELDDLGQW
jgi:uncharacterized protein (DUF952 family)